MSWECEGVQQIDPTGAPLNTAQVEKVFLNGKMDILEERILGTEGFIITFPLLRYVSTCSETPLLSVGPEQSLAVTLTHPGDDLI